MARDSIKKDPDYWLKFIDKKNFDYTISVNAVSKNMARMDHPRKEFDDLGKGVRNRYKRQAHEVLVHHGLAE